MSEAVFKKTRIVHFIWSVPHYRVPIFKRLSGNPFMDFVVCAGSNPKMFAGTEVKTADTQGKSNDIQIKLHLVRSWRLTRGILKDFEWQPGAVAYMLRNDFDAVICLGNKSFSNLLIRLICKMKKIPLLEWTQGVRRPEKGVKWFVLKRFYGLADSLLLYGSRARDFFAAAGFEKKRLFVVNNSLDFDTQVAIRDNISADELLKEKENFGVNLDTGRLIFFSGRLEKRSNLVFLLKALRMVNDEGLAVHLVVIGDGSCGQEYRAKVKSLRLEDQVSFVGACYDEKVLARIMMAADLCVLPGPVGLSAIHSLVYGTPVLTWKDRVWEQDFRGSGEQLSSYFNHGPEVEAIQPGRTGDFYEYGNLRSLLDKLKAMLFPDSCKLKLTDNCKQMVAANYTPAYQEKVIISALNRVLPTNKKILIPA